MNGNFDGMNGMYGIVQFGALVELSRLFGTGGRTSRSWKRAALILAAIAMPAALLLAGRLGS